jgi:hypothetical protein
METAKIPETMEEIKLFVRLSNFFRTNIKDFVRICEPPNKATRRDAKYSKGPITGKAIEAFKI